MPASSSYCDYWCKRIQRLSAHYVRQGMADKEAKHKATMQVRLELTKDTNKVLERFEESKRLGVPFSF